MPHVFGLVDGTVVRYPTRDYILAPILNPRQQKEKEYNKSHRKVRNLVEHAIGVLKAQFACIGTTMRVKNPILVAEIINAVVILHNLLIYDPEYLSATNNGNIDNNGEDREMEEDGGDIEGGKARLREQLQYF
uniref:DDE Tnp4 domain-containing protein n=1 Tax=Acrobeloides nanus TaxID=290746 RepID=A0A914ER95_9BILA